MRSDAEFAALADRFVELKDPNVALKKEVYAHFGLTFFVFGLAEHGLMNAVHLSRVHTSYQDGRVRNAEEWESEWDSIEPALHKMTFGSLAAEATAIPEFVDLRDELTAANRNRNYFAHRLFREVAEYFVSEAGCRLLLVRIAKTRDRIEKLDDEVGHRLRLMLERMKLPSLDSSRLRQMEEAMVKAGEAEIVSGSPKFRWEP